MGPHGLGIAPKPDALILVGEFGLVLMVLEAGIEVDLAQVALVGARGVAVAFAGSLIPLAIGATLARVVFDMNVKSALAIGASLAPTSMGISLKVLQDGGVLSTPTGQLIIAAAVMDDVIALVLLSELEALRDPTPVNFVVPIVSSICFIAVVGYSAVRVIPKVLVEHLVPRVPRVHLEGVLLFLVFVVAYSLMVVLHYGESSHLLGAFLGGLCFCSLASMQHVWHIQVEKILSWLVRVFFACSIGFEVPIADLWTGPVLARTGVFLLAGLGKIGTGIFAKPFSATEAAKIGFAMSAWGEFAFIVATASREAGTLDHQDYSAVVLAVLLSALYAPFAVKFAIDYDKKHAYKIDYPDNSGSARKVDGGEDGFVSARSLEAKHVLHPVYYVSTIHCKSRWGLNDAVLKAIYDPSVGLEVLDIAIKPSGGWTMCELFLRDPGLRAPLDASVRCLENHRVEMKIPILQQALEEAVLLDNDRQKGDEADDSAREGPPSPKDRGMLPRAGEVLLARWIPDIADDVEDNSYASTDELASRQAGIALHGVANGASGTGDDDLVKSQITLRIMQRAGSLVDIKRELQNAADHSLHEAMMEGRQENDYGVNRIQPRLGMGTVNKYRAAAEEMQTQMMERGLSMSRPPLDAAHYTDADASAVTLSGAMGARLASEVRSASFRPEKDGHVHENVSPKRTSFDTIPFRRGSVGNAFAVKGKPSPVRRVSVGNVFGVKGKASPIESVASLSPREPRESESSMVTLTGAGAQRLAMELRQRLKSAELGTQ